MYIAVIIAAAVFIVCALSAGANLSGYERLKTAGFRLIEEIDKEDGAYSNGMFWFNGSFYIDGVEMVRTEQTIIRDGDRELKGDSTYYGPEELDGMPFFNYGGNRKSVTYTDGDVLYRWFDDGGFTSQPNYWKNYRHYRADENVSAIPPAQRRFLEAVMDALIGETRSYFVSDGNYVSISLSGNQIPEIAQYAVAAMAERAGNDLYIGGGDIMIGADARFSHGFLEAEFDAFDNVIGGKVSIEIVSTVNGALKSYRVEAEYRSRDIGSASVEKPNGDVFGMPVLPSFDGDGPDGVTYASQIAFV